MNKPRKLLPGLRYFMCDTCDWLWTEKCRDHSTQSGSSCPNCREFVSPFDSKPKPNWPTDAWGNLVENRDDS